jgi:hypothetical protein
LTDDEEMRIEEGDDDENTEGEGRERDDNDNDEEGPRCHGMHCTPDPK